MTKKDKIEKLREWCDCNDFDCRGCMFEEEVYVDKAWCCNDANYGKDAPEELFDDALKRIEASRETINDIINHPKHYNREGAMESIDEMVLIFGKEVVKHFCLCNAWKYRYRAADKNGIEDMKKSDWYIKKYKELSTVGKSDAWKHDPL